MAQPGQQHEHHEQEATTPSTTAATTTTTTDSKPKTNTSKPAAKPTHTPRRTNGRTNRAFSPRFDVFETEEAYHLYGDLPGVQDKKSVSLEFSDERTLLITGRLERKPIPSTAPTTEKRRSRNPTVEDTDDEDDFSVWLSERVFGHFQRSFSFPTPVDLEAVTAKLEAGLLEIVVPKGFVRTKRIEVQ
ncbi:HSP20-like chaperone [Sphaerosporella brunnea]|uniref:HSP20-like chaperone n=1 Tax=Sphaerosporella brunnea TaxID=1250544 RepID=A0A5J5ESH5_9PEZI|nr:HSP20-like chaperone [Sphaerosporella brunnea]